MNRNESKKPPIHFIYSATILLLFAACPGTGLADDETAATIDKTEQATSAIDDKDEETPDAKPIAETKPDVESKPEVEAKPDTDDKPEPKTEAKPDTDEPEADVLFEQGRDALFQGQYQQAIKLFERAVATDTAGEKTTYRLNLARAYRYAGKSDQSESLLQQILKESPDHVEAGQLLAELHHAAQRWQEMLNVLEPLLEYRHDYSTYHMLGEAAYNLDEFTKAAKFYREAIRLNDGSAMDHYQLGNIHLAENRYARAVTAFEAALKLGLESPVLHYKLASSYFNLRNYFGKVSVATIAAGTPGTISGDWYLIERVPGGKDEFRVAPKSSAIYQIAKSIDDSEEPKVELQMLRANTYLNAHRYQRAHELYQELAKQIGNQSEKEQALYHYYNAESSLGLARYDEYLKHLKKAIELDAETYASALVDAYTVVAEKYNQAGQLDRYIEYLKLAVGESPQNVSLHMKLGNALEETRAYAEAVQQWRMVLDLEPDHPNRTRLLNLIKKHVHSL